MSKKICLVGGPGVGKDAMLDMMINGKLKGDYVSLSSNQMSTAGNTHYKPTVGVEVHPLTVNERHLMIWNCAGDDRYSGLQDGYLVGADAVVYVFSKANMKTFDVLSSYKELIKRICGDIPFLIVGTHDDINSEKMDCLSIDTHKREDVLSVFDAISKKI